MKHTTAIASILAFAAAASAAPLVERVVPESLVSKAWTCRLSDETEMRVTFWRPDVFRIQRGIKRPTGETEERRVINADGSITNVTEAVVKVAYEDPRNDPDRTQIVLPEIAEDASRVKFDDLPGVYIWRTTALTLTLDKASGAFACDTPKRNLFREPEPSIIDTNASAIVIGFAPEAEPRWYGGGQQNGFFAHNGTKIGIYADCKWDEGGHPNPAPWAVCRVDDGLYFGILRNTFAPGTYDFTDPAKAVLSHDEERIDAFFFVGDSFNAVIDRYTEFTGRPNLIPFWGLGLGDADAWITRHKETREPLQTDSGAYVETTPDVIARNAEKYLEADMPCSWLLVNDGYGCKYMQLGWVVEALAGLGFRTGLWTEGALDRMAWEVGTAGTRVQKIDVAWSGPAYQHGLDCNQAAWDGFTQNSNARPFIWTCQGWAGTQRYAVCWTGDQYGDFNLIRYHIPTLITSGMSGQAYATTDIDGIFGGSPETFVRDLQWKCLTPALYVMNGWSNINKAPWSLPEPHRSIARNYLKWKAALDPYTYGLCRDAWDTGAPPVRGLLWNYPDDPVALGTNTQYQLMLGADFLFAPVFEPLEESKGWYRKGVYLPEGTWFDYFDGRRIVGGQTLPAVPVNLETFPVFVRAGAIIPMRKNAVPQADWLDIWPDGESAYSLYEDDGETMAYQSGEWTRRDILVSAPPAERSGDVEIVIDSPRGNGYDGEPATRAWRIDVHTQAKPLSVSLDGMEILPITATGPAAATIFERARQCWFYDKADRDGTVKIKIASRPATDAVSLKLVIPDGLKTPSKPYPTPDPALFQSDNLTIGQSGNRSLQVADAPSLKQTAGDRYEFTIPEGGWKRVSGSVVCAKGTPHESRATFRILTDSGEQIFERAGQKGDDAPQLVAVNIPAGAKKLVFVFTKDSGLGTPTGVWKDLNVVR